MTANTIKLLVDPHPRCHIVYPYTNEAMIADAVSFYSAAGLSQNEAVVLIATPGHSNAIEQRLMADGFAPKKLKADGQLTVLDAEDTLGRLLVGRFPDAALFETMVGTTIDNARRTSSSGKVRLFGEMVSLLYAYDVTAAERLEELWNLAIDRYGVPVLCTYALDGPEPEAQRALSDSLVAAHSHCLPI